MLQHLASVNDCGNADNGTDGSWFGQVLKPSTFHRIAKALDTISDSLEGMCGKWEEKEAPKWERRAFKVWRMGRLQSQRDQWAHDQSHMQVTLAANTDMKCMESWLI